MKHHRQIFLLSVAFLFLLSSGLLIQRLLIADAQDRPLTYPEIITALNTRLPNRSFKTKTQLINWLITQIKNRQVDKSLTADREDDLRQAGATDELIKSIRQNSPPLPTPTPTSTPTSTPTPAFIPTPVPTSTPPSRPKPIQLKVKVLADNTANGWTNCGWVVKRGQKIKITATGRVSLGKGNYTTPEGLASLADINKLMPKEPTGELIAVIGDDNNDFIPIGISREFVANRSGALFLGINEGNLNDNSGAFDIIVEIDPGF